MNEKTRNEFASYGLEILKRAVLLVLYEENLGGEYQLAHKITKRLGIPPQRAFNLNCSKFFWEVQ